MFILPPTRARAETVKNCMPPLGAAYLAAATRDICDVAVLDSVAEGFYNEEAIGGGFVRYGLGYGDIAARIEAFKPDLVGITCLFSSTFPVVRELTAVIKKIDRDIIVGAGGTHPSFLPRECIESSELDFIGLGEGEHLMRELVNGAIENDRLQELDGIAWRDGAGEIHVRPKTRYTKDLDSLPFPARGLLPMELYPKIQIPHSLAFRRRRLANVISSRGCHCRCNFCSSTHFWGGRWRPRGPENVLDEIQELVEDWGIREIQFEDDNMTVDPDRAKAIFRGIIDRGLDISFNFPNGVALWTLDEETIDLMVEAGCYEVVLAFESGAQNVLQNIVHKPMRLDRGLRLARYMRKAGLRTLAFYIVGFPGETLDEIRQTFRFARMADTDMAYFFVANPLPGTALYRTVKERGWLRPGFTFESMGFTNLAYDTPDWQAEEVEKMAAREFAFYSMRGMTRHPVRLGRKIVMDVLLQRPDYLFDTMKRYLKRNIRGQTVD